MPFTKIYHDLMEIYRENTGKTEGRKAVRMVYIKLYFAQMNTTISKRMVRVLDRILMRRWGIVIGEHTRIGKGLKLPHPTSIIMGDGVTLGRNCIVYQNVTLGLKEYPKVHPAPLTLYPTVKDNVILYAGAKIVGEVVVGSNVRVGANSVVTRSLEPDGVYAGMPAKRIR